MAVKENAEPVSDEIIWDVDTEVQLFYAMNGHKPVGVNKYFQMACIIEKFNNSMNKNITSKVIWDHLDTMYDLQALDDSEILPFPNEEKEFCLPASEFAEMMSMKQTVDVKKESKDVKEQKDLVKEPKEMKEKIKETKQELKKETKDIKELSKKETKEVKEAKKDVKDLKKDNKDVRKESREFKEGRRESKDMSKELKKDVKDIKDVKSTKIKIKDKKEDRKEEPIKDDLVVTPAPRKERGRANDADSSSRSSPATVVESTPKRGVITPTLKRGSRGGSILGRRGDSYSSSKPLSPSLSSPPHGPLGSSSITVSGILSGATPSSRASSPNVTGNATPGSLVSSSGAGAQSSPSSSITSGSSAPGSGPTGPKRRRT